MYFEITTANYIKDYQISLTFRDGKTGVVDLKDYVRSGVVFQEFDDLDYFRNFKLEYGTLVWGNGAVDIAPETLYLKSKTTN